MNEELPSILNLLRDNIDGQVFNRNLQKKILYKILENENNKTIFDDYQKSIKSKWQDFVNYNNKRSIKKTYISFLYTNFNEILTFFLQNFFGFNTNQLHLTNNEMISDSQSILEYNYDINPEELEQYDIVAHSIGGNLYGTLFLTGYLFNLVNIIGIIIRKITDEKLLISLDCAVSKERNKEKFLNFMILIREDKKEIYEKYLDVSLFYFLKQFRNVSDDLYNHLLKGREELYQIALSEYNSAKDKLVELFFYFFKKCKLLENFCPILDFFNFVCSRVEDSIYDKVEVIKKEFLNNFDYSTEKKNVFVKIFNFIDRQTSLYSTFQANNLPTIKAQFNLFILITKFYFITGLEPLEVGELLLLPNIFKIELDQYNKKTIGENHGIDSNTVKKIDKFTNFFSTLNHIEDFNVIFKKIFKKGVSQINYRFFRAFLKSLNTKFSMIIEKENQELSEYEKRSINFNVVLDHICRMLYTLIDKIFLKDSPSDASKNFIDPKGRYLGKNIALRILELFMFQEINYSDDIWPEYLVSLNKEKVQKLVNIEIPETFFYSDKDLTKILTIYNFQSFSNAQYLEEWLVNEILVPLNEFMLKITENIKNISDKTEIYNVLYDFILKDVVVENDDKLENLKYICQQLAQFWDNFI